MLTLELLFMCLLGPILCYSAVRLLRLHAERCALRDAADIADDDAADKFWAAMRR